MGYACTKYIVKLLYLSRKKQNYTRRMTYDACFAEGTLIISLFHYIISYARFCKNMIWPRWIVFQLAPQAPDIDP